MSGVDVLAALDDLIADMGDTPGTTGHQVALVRDAVAGLIQQRDHFRGVTEMVATLNPNVAEIGAGKLRQLVEAANAALANVTGDAA